MTARWISTALALLLLPALVAAESYSSKQCPNFSTTEQPYFYLYTGVGFTGSPLYVTNASIANLGNLRISMSTTNYFNDKASSARLRGRWRICTGTSYGGECVEVSSDTWRSEEMVSSLAERFGPQFEDSVSSIKLLSCSQY